VRRIRYANVMATLAVFIALGGTSYAALKITGHNIKNGTVTGRDIKNHSVAKTDVRGIGGGHLQVSEVDGATASYPSGSYGGAPLANCPAGTVVVGTGFNGPFDEVGGFVLSYHTFVGGYFENDSLISLDGNVQAICASTGASAASIASLHRADLRKWHADLALANKRAAK
jgi:hypothetical protein